MGQWSVVEEFVESNADGRVSEDIISISEHFAAVIDGASDATGALFHGLSGGRFAAETVAASIAGLEPEATWSDFAMQITAALGGAVAAAYGDLDDSIRWPAASVICLSFVRSEIWRVGDCSYLADGEVNIGTKRVDDAAYGFRAAINAGLVESGTSVEEITEKDPGARAARPLFDLQQQLSNRLVPWGYGCVNGRPIPDDYVEVFSVEGSREVVLATDGYPRLEATLDSSEMALAKLLAVDPAGIGDLWHMGKCLRPGANSMDDRAYLRLRRRL